MISLCGIDQLSLYPVTRAYYEMLNSICSKTSGCSSELPPKVNRWNDISYPNKRYWWEFIQYRTG